MDHHVRRHAPTPAMVVVASFIARRSRAELVAPAQPTPQDTKLLSDMDDYAPNRYYYPWAEFFQRRDFAGRAALAPEDPAEAIRAALAKALVLYYPLAGRLREAPGGKLVVDCTAEGVVFVEADADVRLQDLGQPLLPPYPCVEELLCDAGDTRVVVAKPIVFLQVTRFKCGGFAIGFQMVHCIADGAGMIQFIKAVADIASGKELPVVLPVWERQLLTARSPPSIAFFSQKLDHVIVKCRTNLKKTVAITAQLDDDNKNSRSELESQYFIFGPAEISALRSHHCFNDDDDDLGRSCTTFELLTAVIWRCRTAALGYDVHAGERSRLAFAANARRKVAQIPHGYYGNAFMLQVVQADAGKLCSDTLGHTIGLIRAAKSETTEEHLRSAVDYVASLRGAAPSSLTYDQRTYFVSDVTSLGEDKLDLGWAQWIAGGRATPSSQSSNHRKCKNSEGEDAVAVSMVLPKPAMDRFRKELAAWLMKDGRPGRR
ncbi:hypothetical protein ABZP36_011426 [Zizania latifolia]